MSGPISRLRAHHPHVLYLHEFIHTHNKWVPALNILYLYKYINKSVLSLETPMFAAPSTSSDQRPPPPTNILTTSFHHNAPDALNMPVRTSIEIHHNAPDAQSTTSVHEFTYHEEEDAKKAKKKRK